MRNIIVFTITNLRGNDHIANIHLKVKE